MNKIFGSETLYNVIETVGKFFERAGRTVNKNEKAFLCVFTAVFLSWALFATIHTANLVINSERTTGVIVDFTASKGSVPEKRTYHPIIKFKAGDGLEYKFKSGTGFKGNYYRESDSVEIIYRKDRPDAAEINSFQTLWLMPVLLFIASGIGIAGLLYPGSKKPAKDPELAFLETNEIDKKS